MDERWIGGKWMGAWKADRWGMGALSQGCWRSVLYVSMLQGYLEKCNKQIDDTVSLVRGQLNQGSRITIEALIVIDVHGESVTSKVL